jgi:hypothetical protein
MPTLAKWNSRTKVFEYGNYSGIRKIAASADPVRPP